MNNFKIFYPMSADKKKLKVSISDSCSRCGTCVAMYPDIFEFADDGSVVVKSDANFDDISAEELEEVCPMGAISAKKED